MSRRALTPFSPSIGIHMGFFLFFVFHYVLYLVIVFTGAEQQITSSSLLVRPRQHSLSGEEWRVSLSCCQPLNPLSFSFSVCPVEVTSKQLKIGKTNILGGAAGLFGGFGPLMCDPVTFSGLSTGASSEVTRGQTFREYVTNARELFSQSRLLKAGQSDFVWNAATEPFTPPGAYDRAPLYLQLPWMIRIGH